MAKVVWDVWVNIICSGNFPECMDIFKPYDP